MTTKKTIALAVLATTMTLTSLTTLAQDGRRDGNRHGDKNEFKVCTPYRMEVATLSDNLGNFEDQVMAPLQRELSGAASKVSQRLSEERKLESVVNSIQRDISNSERRLRSIPSLIIKNTNEIANSKSEIVKLGNKIKSLEVELQSAGWIRKKVIKAKIKGAKKDIKKENESIQKNIRANASMEEESRQLPDRIVSLRQRLSQADSALAAQRSKLPTLDQLRDVERGIRNRLDNQEDIRSDLERKLVRSQRDFGKCKQISSDAKVYSHLGVMANRLRKSNCELEAVRSRLPYNISKAEQRALAEANDMVCTPTEPVTINQ